MPPKKRGRKPKKKTNLIEKPPPKKRGRKPKGGKIIKKNEKIKTSTITQQPNIILHLKCSSKDLENVNTFSATNYTPNIADPQAYNIQNNTKMFDLQFEEINHKKKKPAFFKNLESKKDTQTNDNTNMKEIWHKLNSLKVN